MNTAELLRQSLSSVGAHKLRSALTMLGIAVGVFSVLGAMTAIAALQRSIEAGLTVLGANSFQITKFPPIQFGGPDTRFANRRDLDFATVQRFAALMEGSGAEISFQLTRGGRQFAYLDRRTNPNHRLVGSDPNFVTGRNYEIAAGRNLTVEDVEFGRAVAVIGADLVSRLFPAEDPLGRTIRVDGQSLIVVGVLAAKGTSFGASQDNLAVVPITRFLQAFGRTNRSISLNVQAPSQAELAATQDRAVGVMRVVRGLGPEDPNDFEVFSNDSLIEAFDRIAGVVAVGAFVISLIALVVAGVGIMNIMLVSVTERTKEIGIRMSLGARRRQILRQFLIEATFIAQLGGIAGILFGVGGGNLVAMMLNVPPVFPVGWAAVGFCFCTGIGIAFGAYPAWKAARLDPIEALRFE
jgi:putative ABC transport system permease protein